MDGIGFETVLNSDPRPSFVLDIHDIRRIGHVEPVASNIAFRKNAYFRKLISQEHGSASTLRAWISRPSQEQAGAESDHECNGPDGTRWFAWTIQGRWRVVQLVSSTAIISTNHEPQNGYPTPPEDGHHFDHTNQTSITFPLRTKADKRTSIMRAFDISPEALKKIAGLEELIGNMCNVDWDSTVMGPIEHWPPELCQPIHTMLLSLDQMYVVFLGPDHNLLYNVAYTKIAGERHPAILGAPLYEAWPEAADINRANFEYIDATGAPYTMPEHRFCLDRNGYLEEIYVRWTTSAVLCSLPVYLCICLDTTQKVGGARRQESLIKVNPKILPEFSNMSELWNHVIEILGANEDDFPLGFVYSKSTTVESAYCLQGIFGYERTSDLLPQCLDYATDESELAKVFGQAERSLNPIRITESGGLPTKLIDACTSRSFGDRCTEAMVCSLRRATDNEVMGIMVIGLHTRKGFDFDDELFFQNTSRNVSDLAFKVYTKLLGEQLAKEAELQNAKHETLIKALSTSTSEFTYASSKLQRILQIVERLDVGIYEFDTTGKLLQANESYFKLSGHPRGVDAAGGSWLDCMYEEDLPQAHKNWEMLLAGEALNTEIRFKKRATTPSSEHHNESEEPEEPFIWVMAAVTPVIDPVTGQLASISGCLTDISAAKRSQVEILKRTEALERARASEQRFVRFTEFAACPVAIHRPDLTIEFCNQAYYELLGVDPAGGPSSVVWPELVLEGEMPNITEKWTDAQERVVPFNIEARLKKRFTAIDGSSHTTFVVASVYPETDYDNTITSWMVIAFDISHIKWAEKDQEKRALEAVEAKRQQENFIDMTSHEIRNPLGAVVHCADSILTSLIEMEEILKDQDDEGINHYKRKQLMDIYESNLDAINTIISCSTHQKRIVDDVLTWSKLNSQLLKITPSLIRVKSITQDVRNMFEIDAQKVGVDFVVQQDVSIEQMTTEYVMLDSGRLMQVLINLVTNAIKFTREEVERHVTVSMGMSRNKPSLDVLPVDFIPTNPNRNVTIDDAEWGKGELVYIYFTVRDTGCGLTDDEKSKIFTRFSQGSPRTHTRYGGSGLGLFISRELVELQSGEIGFASAPGQGSTFAFFITARIAPPPAAKLDLSRLPPPRSCRMSSSSTSNGVTRHCILIVEDNIINQAVLSKQLRKLGHEVHVASHGGEALDFLQKTNVWAANQGSGIDLGVVLMDIEMPVMDGITCAERIRDLEKAGQIEGRLPIIAVSANARTEQVGQALACGMDDAIAKPFRIVDLMPKIEKLVR
ncbi:hypothetical protein MBLNU457_1616t2 [Dothideomycetes sp. NU457]